jgi:hypothetical protein
MVKDIFSKIVDVKPNELRALWLGFAFHFIILTAYYIVKPIRDSIAAGNRIETLPWMFTATLVVMLIANTIFAAIVARMERRKFIPFAYAFFILVLILFFLLMRTGSPAQQVWTGRAFYVWVSVFNLFNTAIFWAFMTDLFTVEQGKRLYGFIAVGGNARSNRRRLHHEKPDSWYGPSQPCRNFSSSVCDRLLPGAIFPEELHRSHRNRAGSRRANRRDSLVWHHAHRALALFVRLGCDHTALYHHIYLGLFSADNSRWCSFEDERRSN